VGARVRIHSVRLLVSRFPRDFGTGKHFPPLDVVPRSLKPLLLEHSKMLLTMPTKLDTRCNDYHALTDNE